MAKQESGLSEKPDNRRIFDFRGEFELMKDFIDSNPGLQSRFNKYIDFPDYSVEELMMIFAKFAAQNQYVLTLEAREEVRKTLEREQRESGGKCANARLVRNVFEIAIEHQANRVALVTQPNDEDLQKITVEDVLGIDIPN